MDTDSSSLWWIVMLVTGAVGAGMLIYGIRQKEPVALAFGVALNVLPMVISSGLAAAALSVLVIALFFVVRKYV